MTSKNKLTDADVRSIFECLHHKTPIPDHLKFTIVPVGASGQRLSPPSHEFTDGLYVLLRPAKKPKDKAKAFTSPQAPAHLEHLVWKDPLPENCPWSISGPQYSHQTAIQQRYCYPTGRPEYSSTKGGSVWTMYDANGQEDYEYRLLHVYYSVKRASNRGGERKGRKRAKRSSPQCSPARSYAPPPAVFHSPTNTTASASTMCSSIPSPISPHGSVDLTGLWPERQAFLSPINDIMRSSYVDNDTTTSLGDDAFSQTTGPTTSPFRRPIYTSDSWQGTTVSPLQRTNAGIAMPDDYSDLWNDPILSYDDEDEYCRNDEFSFASSQQMDAAAESNTGNYNDQTSLMSQMTDWAHRLADSPLADCLEGENELQNVAAFNLSIEAGRDWAETHSQQ